MSLPAPKCFSFLLITFCSVLASDHGHRENKVTFEPRTGVTLEEKIEAAGGGRPVERNDPKQVLIRSEWSVSPAGAADARVSQNLFPRSGTWSSKTVVQPSASSRRLSGRFVSSPQIRIRMGRYGPFLECGNLKVSASAHITNANKKDPTDLTMPSQPTPAELLQQQQQGGDSAPAAASALGSPADASANDTVVYSAEDVIAFGLGANSSGDGDAAAPGSSGGAGAGGAGTWYSAVSLDRAVGLLSLPRVVCESHPTEGGPIEVGVGRFGVWVKHKDSYKNVPGGIDVLDVDEALAVQLTDEMIQVT